MTGTDKPKATAPKPKAKETDAPKPAAKPKQVKGFFKKDYEKN